MSDEIIGSIDLPLDSDGFLRRKCPHCEREFKWLPSDSATEMEPGGYHCPYCDGRSGADAWRTKAQLRAIQAEGGYYMESKLHDVFKGMERKSSRSVQFKAGPPPRKPRQALSEPDDMGRVDFACHPEEPVKVIESWREGVHCLVCGSEE